LFSNNLDLSWITNFKQSLFKEESAASLGLFRMLLGIVLFAQTLWFIKTEFIVENVFEPSLHFKFYYFQFLEPLSKPLMKIMMLLMLVSTLLVAIGKLFKPALVFFGLSFTYLWLLDKSYFNNHYYLISLLVFLLLFTNANSWGGYGSKKGTTFTVPYWQIFIIKFQIFIVFFIAGINKINTYWMVDMQPMKHILETKASLNNYDWLANDFSFAFFSWLGLLFDLSIGFLIWLNKTRRFALVFYILFNIINFWLFYDIGEIGFFPFILLACLTIFFESAKVEQKLGWLNKKVVDENLIEKESKNTSVIITCLVVYIALQVLLPFRYLLYDNHVDWSGKGQRFAWRMKIMYKDPDMHFYLIEEGSEQKVEVNVGNFLNSKQYTNLIYYPDFIPTVAKYIKEEAIRRGMKNPKVVANFKIGFMGHSQTYLVNPETDLSQVEYLPLKSSSWILPLALDY
tara:strand:- start:78 stop:1445 length:1368 start_codon:yes stop_codon:yes gene_type:complete